MDQNKPKENSNAQVKKMLADSGYSEKAIQYFLDKPNMGVLPQCDHESEMTGSCGDTMSIGLKFERDVILEAKYQVLGCPGAVASAMAVADLVKGMKIEDARKLNDGDVFRLLEEMPAKKHHCIQLAVKTLQKALAEYSNKSN